MKAALSLIVLVVVVFACTSEGKVTDNSVKYTDRRLEKYYALRERIRNRIKNRLRRKKNKIKRKEALEGKEDLSIKLSPSRTEELDQRHNLIDTTSPGPDKELSKLDATSKTYDNHIKHKVESKMKETSTEAREAKPFKKVKKKKKRRQDKGKRKKEKNQTEAPEAKETATEVPGFRNMRRKAVRKMLRLRFVFTDVKC